MIVLTKNEEAAIATVLARVSEFDDVIVVDSKSTDRTGAIASEAGARVVQFEWNGNYPKKKQWSLEQAGAKHQWVLLLDADEYPSPALTREIKRLVDSGRISTHGAWDVNLQYRFGGKFLRYGHKVTKRSLIDTARSSFPEVDDLDAPGIREVEGHYQPQTTSSVGRLRHQLFHNDVDPVRTWFDRHNRYSDWEAHLNTRPATKADIASKRTLKGRIFDRLPFKPGLFFAYAYLARLGFLDGRAGFDYALALSMYYWQIGVKTRELTAAIEASQREPLSR